MTTTSASIALNEIEVDGAKEELHRVRMAVSSRGPATARILLMPAGEASNPDLGDGFSAAMEWLQQSSASVEIAYPDFAKAPGWYVDRPEIGRSPEAAILSLARFWQNAHPLPLYLMGFSKSGYAAVSLLARHRDERLFSGAMAWDAPLMLQEISSNSMLESYGSPDNFNACRVDRRIRDLGAAVADDRARLVLDGFNAWGRQMQEYHRLLVEAGVAHHYGETRRNWHRWDVSWMSDCLDRMFLPEPRDLP